MDFMLLTACLCVCVCVSSFCGITCRWSVQIFKVIFFGSITYIQKYVQIISAQLGDFLKILHNLDPDPETEHAQHPAVTLNVILDHVVALQPSRTEPLCPTIVASSGGTFSHSANYFSFPSLGRRVRGMGTFRSHPRHPQLKLSLCLPKKTAPGKCHRWDCARLG